MSSPETMGTIGPRFADHSKELGLLAEGPVKTAEIAGRVMMLAGDLLRRTQALGGTASVAKHALEQVEEGAATAFVQSIDPATENARLTKALNEAFEAMLAQAPEGDGASSLAEAALEGLVQRDKLASVGAALDHKGLDRSLLDARLAQIDGTLAKKARMLVGLNEARRRELDALDAPARSAAWWYGARAKCDRLRGLYTGQDVTRDAHVESCADCLRDMAAAGDASVPSHLDAMSLERRESGTASPAEIAWMDAHAKTCNGCKRALDALSVSVE